MASVLCCWALLTVKSQRTTNNVRSYYMAHVALNVVVSGIKQDFWPVGTQASGLTVSPLRTQSAATLTFQFYFSLIYPFYDEALVTHFEQDLYLFSISANCSRR